MASRIEFEFRVWVHPEDSDTADIEIWSPELEPTDGNRSVDEWARESLSYEDLHELFDLDKTKHWQVVGRASIHGWCNAWDGEYDEEIEVVEFKKAEVPDSWFNNTELPPSESA